MRAPTKSQAWRLMLLVVVACLVSAGSIAEGAATTVAAPASPTAGGATQDKRLFAEMPGNLDDLGRVPLSRLGFAPGASLPDDLLIGPAVVFIEAGQFRFSIDGHAIDVAAGAPITVRDGVVIAARNTSNAEGSWLILWQYGTVEAILAAQQRLPFDFLCPTPCLPTGLTHALLFLEINLRGQLMPARFSVDRVTLQPGDELDSLDFGGETAVTALFLRVESGAVELVEQAIGIGAGMEDDTEVLTATEPSRARVVGLTPAIVLVVRVAEPES